MNRQMLCGAVIALTFAAGCAAAANLQITGGAQSIVGSSGTECAGLTSMDFSATPEAPAQIFKTELVEASGNLPSFCTVNGVVMPSVGFTLKLPIVNWNGRFFEAGCGGYCGVDFEPRACDEPLRRGYACIVTDAGHLTKLDRFPWAHGEWAFNNVERELDYGGRASHVTAVAGKAITARFYAKPASKSYFMGCSYGGHQAMVLAQRYPWDFDGIVGGGVPNNLGDLMQQNLWAMRHGFDKNLKSIFSDADIHVLHDAVLARCDLDDGIKDGLIGNPRACKVNPDELICKDGKTRACLSQAAADAAKKMYSGPINSRGEKVSGGGWMPGSELYWGRVYTGFGAGLALMAENYFRYMNGFPSAGPGWSPSAYDFDVDYKRNDVTETLYAADNPDLRRFKAAGGKFITYVGWNDLGALPDKAIDYYETTERTMGGRASTQDFFRMFTIPGALHCRGGDGADDIDFLSYIEAWVERGQAPNVMIGTHRSKSGNAEFTRPAYPYPQQAHYKGTGDPHDAANFKPVTPLSATGAGQKKGN